jgi:Flp pilus assembly protein TadG
MCTHRRWPRPWLRRFIADQRGATMLLYALMIPVVMGIIGLSLDSGRYTTLNTELQDLADAAAIAGAKELDAGTVSPNAIERAEARARTLFQQRNDPRWAEGTYTGTIITAGTAGVEFYERNAAGNIGNATTNPAQASYIRVSTASRSVLSHFVRAVGGTGNASTQATAIAESIHVACNVQPLGMCDPMQPLFGRELSTAQDRGRMFRLKATGAGASYAPGFFGLLDPPNLTSSGANLIKQNLAESAPNFCYISNLSVRTGSAVGPVGDGINTRFDMYPSGGATELLIPPPPVNIKGLTPQSGQCSQFSNADTGPTRTKLPRDQTFTQVNGFSWVGDKVWTTRMGEYWTNNHGGSLPTITGPAGETPIRFDYYRYELAVNEDGSPTGATPPAFGGTSPEIPYAGPVCYANRTGSSAVGTVNRRVIYVAIFNPSDCALLGGNSGPPMRAVKMAKFFITEPVEQDEIVAEFIRMIEVGSDDGKLHHVIQLVR